MKRIVSAIALSCLISGAISSQSNLPFSFKESVSTYSESAPKVGASFFVISTSQLIEKRKIQKMIANQVASLGYVESSSSDCKFWVVWAESNAFAKTVTLAPSDDQKKKAATANFFTALGAAGAGWNGKQSGGRLISPEGTKVDIYSHEISLWFLIPGTTQEEFNTGRGIIWQGQIAGITPLPDNYFDALPTLLKLLFSEYPKELTDKEFEIP